MPTRPGINPNFDFSKFTAKDVAVVKRLAEDFYVTRAANPVNVGNSQYKGLLVRPSDDASIALNVEREFLVLLADYEAFEHRTLGAYDRLNEQFEVNRVDRSLRFLVSGDPTIHDQIRHYLQQDPEYPIVIPFTI